MKNLISIMAASVIFSQAAFAIGGASGTKSYAAQGKIGAVIMNPYKVAPLSAVILNGGYDIKNVSVSVKGKPNGGIDINYNPSNNSILTYGGIPIFGLYADYVNKVVVSYERSIANSKSEKISEEYEIYAPPIYTEGTGTNQLGVLPKAVVSVKADEKFKNNLYLINHLIRAPLANSAQAVWNNPVGGAMEWDLQSYNWMVDTNGDVRWYLKNDEIRNPDDIYKKGNMMGFTQDKDGALFWGMGQRYMKYDLLGREIFNKRLPSAYIDFSHHIEHTSKDTYLLRVASANQKRKDNSNVRSVRDVIIEVDNNGKVIDEWKLYDILDPYRDTNLLVLDQGAVCLNVDKDKAGQTVNKEDLEDKNSPFGDVTGVGVGRNWAHVNSVSYDDKDDSIIISVRHQSAIVKIGRDKKIKWILGAHKGWSKEFQKYLLQPVDSKGKKIVCEDEYTKCPGYENDEGGFDFTWTQHTAYYVPSMSKKNEIVISVFDNGDTRGMHQPAFATSKYSRAVFYKINEKTMKVEQIWEYGKERGFDYYSPVTSITEYFDKTKSVFVYSATAGLGKYMLNIGKTEPILDEIDYKTKKVLFEMKFENMGGQIGYRAYPIDVKKAFE
ncbi:aryl-sulfate sulfotransferase [Campylobacter canadensis]|uniref:Aryl-sulfate sulfotransferase n=1 Tax=Campylobacter canadensis TaxID=449520 RepID=A0ABS7WR03_9BACT|nr:aryl-sulfate sulfotransferase [Campylobacter canadensis]MBZ7986953.1 aryl-sulfate sulfotransferase [Campylobacter canadensis]MBZ7994272.1 aryl-sulfate sulfotransferase [Campylobacter canadensis]MBZ7995736.1 aryl-sulfate sulfotransferase [Campylobacter canadensis]MBZ7997989.1 aryl-sulfate sulfotransferase [Campylobacter canadensis]MBZ7999604.1 aryl-sulfate sulfotransferase [Campylobacter canadensis]